jgi:hypothetical protein
MVCVVDDLGARVVAASVLPIGAQTLLHGVDDGGAGLRRARNASSGESSGAASDAFSGPRSKSRGGRGPGDPRPHPASGARAEPQGAPPARLERDDFLWLRRRVAPVVEQRASTSSTVRACFRPKRPATAAAATAATT